MEVKLKFDVGQTVYRIEGRAEQLGTVESYTIRMNCSLGSNQHIEEYVVKYGNPSYPTRIKYLKTELHKLFESKEECEKEILRTYFGHLLKEGAIK